MHRRFLSRRSRNHRPPRSRDVERLAKGLNVVFVSRQLGHANPNVTLEVYAHLFGRADRAQAARNGSKRATRR